MEKYSANETKNTPSICFDFENGFIEIKGRSNPNNSYAFFNALLDIIDEYIVNPKPHTTISLNLDYLSTGSSKCILEFLKKFEKVQEKGKIVKVDWHYQDEDILEAGENYQAMINLPFQMHLCS